MAAHAPGGLGLLAVFAVLLALLAPRESYAACPNPAAGVLKKHNAYRALHGAPPLQWDVKLAARAQGHANTCKWGHSTGEELAGSGESIYSSSGVPYPLMGMDVCTYATYGWYMEVTSYDFHKPGMSKDDVQVGHFTSLVWTGTTKIGCGYAKCPTMDYVVCQYNPRGNRVSSGNPLYRTNVKRSSCQAATQDDWCSACSGGTCRSCYSRPRYSQRMSNAPISLDPGTKKCVSQCPPGSPNATNCAACSASGTCVRCKPGWKLSAQKQCTVKAKRRALTLRRT